MEDIIRVQFNGGTAEKCDANGFAKTWIESHWYTDSIVAPELMKDVLEYEDMQSSKFYDIYYGDIDEDIDEVDAKSLLNGG